MPHQPLETTHLISDMHNKVHRRVRRTDGVRPQEGHLVVHLNPAQWPQQSTRGVRCERLLQQIRAGQVTTGL